MWIDLDVFPGGISDLKSGLQRSVVLNDKAHSWTAELAIPMKALTAHFDPAAVWRGQFFRIVGYEKARFFQGLQTTPQSIPDIHLPSRLGKPGLCPAPVLRLHAVGLD